MSDFIELIFSLRNNDDGTFSFVDIGNGSLFRITFNDFWPAYNFGAAYNSPTNNNIVTINGITIATGIARIVGSTVFIDAPNQQIGPISSYINVSDRAFKHPIVFGPEGRFGTINISNMGFSPSIVLNDFSSARTYEMRVTINSSGNSESTINTNLGLITAVGNPLTLACLLKGTKILTPNGEILIENLSINDIVLTSDNREVKIIDIYNTLASSEDNLYVIHKDTISKEIPNEDLFFSGGHRVKIHGKFYHPFHNKTNLIQKCDDTKLIQFYHIKLENYLTDFLVANGLEVESLGDVENPEHTTWNCNGDQCILLINNEKV
jgi:hypothetical protein